MSYQLPSLPTFLVQAKTAHDQMAKAGVETIPWEQHEEWCRKLYAQMKKMDPTKLSLFMRQRQQAQLEKLEAFRGQLDAMIKAQEAKGKIDDTVREVRDSRED